MLSSSGWFPAVQASRATLFGGLQNKGDELDIFMTLEYSRSFLPAEMLDNVLFGQKQETIVSALLLCCEEGTAVCFRTVVSNHSILLGGFRGF